MGITLEKSSGRSVVEKTFICAAISFVLWFHFWTVDSSLGFRDRQHEEYYRLLVDAFRGGHTYLPIETNPGMFTLSDPYDPAQNSAYRLPDGSYYRGKYYLYFGATPALALLLPYCLLTGAHMTTGVAVYLYCTLGFLCLSWIWLRVRRDYFPESRGWVAPLGILVLGLCTHTLALERRAMFWELPIAAGHAFACAMLACLYRAVRQTRPSVVLGFAGLCLGLAATSRPPYLLTLSLFLPLLWLALRRERSVAVAVRWFTPAAAAFLLCVIGTMAYNYARFGHPLQFGQDFQLTGAYERKMRHFHFSYFVHNLYVYYVCPVRWTWEFPFVLARPPENSPPGYYAGEPVAGLGATFFIFWTGLAAPLLYLRARRDRVVSLAVFLGSAALLALTMAVFLGSFFSATPRYQADFSPYLVLIAVCGWLELERRLCRGVFSIIGRWLLGFAALLSVLFGLLLSVDYHSRILWRDHYTLWLRIQDFWDPKIARARSLIGFKLGRHTIRVRFPAAPAGKVETLWSLQTEAGREQALLTKVDDLSWKVGYESTALPLRWSAPFAGNDGQEHLIELQTPGLQEPVDRSRTPRAVRRALLARGTAVIWVDGKRALSLLAADLDGPSHKIVEAPSFSGEVVRTRNKLPRLDAIPEATQRTWSFSGFSDVLPGASVPLVSWGKEDGRETFLFRRNAENRGQIMFRSRLGNETLGPEFPLGRGPLHVEIEHRPVWPWSAGDGELQSFTVYAEDRPAGDFRLRVFGATAESVWTNNARSGTLDTSTNLATRIPAEGGVLRLRFLAEPGTFRFGQPLIVLGNPGAGDLISLRDIGETKILFDHWGAALLESRPFTLREGAVNTLEVRLPSFSPPNAGQGKRGMVNLRLNGRIILSAPGESASFGPESFHIGENPLGGSNCELEFGGYILDTRWIVDERQEK